MFKKLLAFLLSLQMGALHYAIPLIALSFSQQAIAGETANPVEIVRPDKDKKQSEPMRIDMDGHGSKETIQPEAPAKSSFCKDPTTGKMKGGCIVALILIVGALAAILIANSNNGSSKKTTYGGSGYNGYGGGRPGTRPPGGGRPPWVPCCGKPAPTPAPAPSGGGVTEISTVTTSNVVPAGVTPIIVTPENAQPAPSPSATDGDL